MRRDELELEPWLHVKTDAPETITRAYRTMLSEPDGNAAGERDDDRLAVRFGLCICGCVAWC